MVLLKKSVFVAVGVVAVTVGMATPAVADPGDNPCGLALSFLCRMVPIAPGLDHDVDLTQDPNGLSELNGVDGETPPETPAGDPNVVDAPPSG